MRARDLAVRKALVARRAADMAMEALELFAEFGGNGEEGNGDNDGGRKMVVDNAMSELRSFRKGDKGLVFFRRKRRGISLAEKILGGLCFRNAGACGEDGNCGCKIVSYPLVYSRSRRKVKDRNLDLRLDGEESCSNKVINSNGNDNSMNPMSPYSVEGDESVAVEDEFSYGNDDPRLLDLEEDYLSVAQRNQQLSPSICHSHVAAEKNLSSTQVF
ncbi:hypothetical protein Tsubulata_033037 [Turnera subulata]|uniref:Uncharacterized protein n=1 Tax=Turnera subulata TaxID=218843 RepID=A0A9Q0JC56_9ROSI|nr:hypothetical protein Tsubulata_033037 [Turnera subulata]